jgi:hypothetical protein
MDLLALPNRLLPVRCLSHLFVNPSSPDRVELTGRIRTAKSCIEWIATAIHGRAVLPDLESDPTDLHWSIVRAERWDSETNVTYVLTLIARKAFRSQDAMAPTSVYGDGLAIDVRAGSTGKKMKLLDVVSNTRSPATWEDDEKPTVNGRGPKAAYYTKDFWLGLFADDIS